MDYQTFATFADVQADKSVKNIEKLNKTEIEFKKVTFCIIQDGQDLYRYLAWKILQVKYQENKDEDLLNAAEVQALSMPDPFLKDIAEKYDKGLISKITAIELTQKEKKVVFIFSEDEKIIN